MSPNFKNNDDNNKFSSKLQKKKTYDLFSQDTGGMLMGKDFLQMRKSRFAVSPQSWGQSRTKYPAFYLKS